MRQEPGRAEGGASVPDLPRGPQSSGSAGDARGDQRQQECSSTAAGNLPPPVAEATGRNRHQRCLTRCAGPPRRSPMRGTRPIVLLFAGLLSGGWVLGYNLTGRHHQTAGGPERCAGGRHGSPSCSTRSRASTRFRDRTARSGFRSRIQVEKKARNSSGSGSGPGPPGPSGWDSRSQPA